MDPSEAEATFRTMLIEAGFTFERPDPAVAWRVFKDFVRRPARCAHDGVLFQCGVYDWSGTPLFTLDFVRQFTIDIDDGYDHTEQLHCTFTCPPTKPSSTPRSSLWLEDFANREEFFAAIEALAGFREGVRHAGWTCRLMQHEV